MVFKPLTEEQKERFQMFSMACRLNSIWLISTKRKSDGADVAVICIADEKEDGGVDTYPIALLLDEDDIDQFEDPSQ